MQAARQLWSLVPNPIKDFTRRQSDSGFLIRRRFSSSNRCIPHDRRSLVQERCVLLPVRWDLYGRQRRRHRRLQRAVAASRLSAPVSLALLHSAACAVSRRPPAVDRSVFFPSFSLSSPTPPQFPIRGF